MRGKGSFLSGTANSFQMINERLLTGSHTITYLSDSTLAFKEHRA